MAAARVQFQPTALCSMSFPFSIPNFLSFYSCPVIIGKHSRKVNIKICDLLIFYITVTIIAVVVKWHYIWLRVHYDLLGLGT